MSKQKDPLAGYSFVAKLVDKIADANGIGPEHVARHPELLEEAGLDAEDIDDDVVHDARVLHRYKMGEIRRRAAAL